MILATIKQINQKQLILVQGEDSKKGQLIYLTRKGSFQVILYKMIRFLSGKLKKHTKLAKIVKISIFVNRLVFPMNFNRFCHPMTLQLGKEVENNKLGKIFYTEQFNPSFVFCLVLLQVSIHHHSLVLNPNFMCAFCLQKFLYLFIPFGVLILHRNFSTQELNYKGSVETFVTSPLDFSIDYFTFHILI